MRNCADVSFVQLHYFQAHRLAYTYSIHLPGSIVFLTVGFLFPVLAEHTAPLTRTRCQSSPSFSLWSVWLPLEMGVLHLGPIFRPQISQFEASSICGSVRVGIR